MQSFRLLGHTSGDAGDMSKCGKIASGPSHASDTICAFLSTKQNSSRIKYSSLLGGAVNIVIVVTKAITVL